MSVLRTDLVAECENMYTILLSSAVTLGRAYDGGGASPVGFYKVTPFVTLGGRLAALAAVAQAEGPVSYSAGHGM